VSGRSGPERGGPVDKEAERARGVARITGRPRAGAAAGPRAGGRALAAVVAGEGAAAEATADAGDADFVTCGCTAVSETRRASPSQRSWRWLIAGDDVPARAVANRGTPTAFVPAPDRPTPTERTVAWAAAGATRRLSMGLKVRADMTQAALAAAAAGAGRDDGDKMEFRPSRWRISGADTPGWRSRNASERGRPFDRSASLVMGTAAAANHREE